MKEQLQARATLVAEGEHLAPAQWILPESRPCQLIQPLEAASQIGRPRLHVYPGRRAQAQHDFSSLTSCPTHAGGQTADNRMLIPVPIATSAAHAPGAPDAGFGTGSNFGRDGVAPLPPLPCLTSSRQR